MAVDEGWVCVALEDGENVVVVHMAPKLTRCVNMELYRVYLPVRTCITHNVNMINPLNPNMDLIFIHSYYLDGVGSNELNSMAAYVCFIFSLISRARCLKSPTSKSIVFSMTEVDTSCGILDQYRHP